MNTPKEIIIHCSDVKSTDIPNQLYSINRYHMGLDFPKSRLGYFVGYHALVTGGQIYKTKEDDEVGAHCNQIVDGESMNLQSLGICWGGDGDVELPDTKSFELIKKQIFEWQDKYKISDENVKFHHEYATYKTCPGTLLDENWLRGILKRKDVGQESKQDQILRIHNQLSAVNQILLSLQNLLSRRSV